MCDKDILNPESKKCTENVENTNFVQHGPQREQDLSSDSLGVDMPFFFSCKQRRLSKLNYKLGLRRTSCQEVSVDEDTLSEHSQSEALVE